MSLKSRGEDADHGVRYSVERDRLPHHSRVAAEPALPDAVAQDGNMGRAGATVLRHERATEYRLDAEDAEQLRGGQLYRNLLRLPAAGEAETLVRERCHALERCALLAPGSEVSARSRVLVPPFRTDLPQHDDPLRVAEGQRPHKQFVDDREDCSVCPDPQGEGEHRDRREALVLGQYTHPVANVLQ